MGTNILVGQDLGRLRREVETILAGTAKAGQVPPLWDGKAGQRIADVLCSTNPSALQNAAVAVAA
jgi:UDP-N-acetylglucosamine 2-epimerase (non-hydrolysing)